MGELRDFAPQLAQWLAAGDGAGDVVGLEEGILLQYIENPDGFLNLFDYGRRRRSRATTPTGSGARHHRRTAG